MDRFVGASSEPPCRPRGVQGTGGMLQHTHEAWAAGAPGWTQDPTEGKVGLFLEPAGACAAGMSRSPGPHAPSPGGLVTPLGSCMSPTTTWATDPRLPAVECGQLPRNRRWAGVGFGLVAFCFYSPAAFLPGVVSWVRPQQTLGRGVLVCGR